MGEVVDINSKAVMYSVEGPSGTVYSISLESISKLADGRFVLIRGGKNELPDIDLIRGILKDWLVVNGY